MNSLIDICLNYLIVTKYPEHLLINKLPLELYEKYYKFCIEKECGNKTIPNVFYNELRHNKTFLPSEQLSITQAIQNKVFYLVKDMKENKDMNDSENYYYQMMNNTLYNMDDGILDMLDNFRNKTGKFKNFDKKHFNEVFKK